MKTRTPELYDVVVMGWTALVVVEVRGDGFVCRCPDGREFWSSGLGHRAVEVFETAELKEAA